MRLPKVLLCAAAVALAAPAGARELHWKQIAVTARIDAQGVLHVRERQHAVMTGDWNGGERSFRIEPAQDLQLQAMRRIDPSTGAAREMQEGDLDEVDHYAWTSGNVLRWRSRLPTHAEFDRTDLVHELDYALYGALQPYGDAWLLAHDFAFADRSGVIESFVVDLAIDPAWNVDEGHQRRFQAGPLQPGNGYTVRLALRPTAGASVATLSPARQRALLVLLAVPVLLLLTLFVSEWIRGRLAPLDPAGAARALEGELLAHPAEVIGAVWDRTVGADEVGALIARLAAEGKIKTTVLKNEELQMTLLVDRERFDGYERELIDAFFYGDRTTTNTSQIRNRYEKTGFDPAGKIRPGVEEKVAALTGPPALRLPVWLPTVLAIAAGMYVAFFTGGGPFDGRMIGVVTLFLPAVLIGGVGAALASVWRARIDRGVPGAAGFVIVIATLVGLAAEVVTGFRDLPWLGALAGATGGVAPQRQWAAVLFALAMVNSIVNAARSRERMQGIALRKRLASARRFFQDEFRKPEPALRDAWFPYVLALGLDGESRRWFKSFGGVSSDRSSGWSVSSGSSASSGSSSSSGPSGWTGGGGAFGGAGATASWAAAAGALSAGVAAPSSSSSGGSGGGGGGGGGSSSGGGGGGGW